MIVLTIILWILWTAICAFCGIATMIGVVTIFAEKDKIDVMQAKFVVAGILFEVLALTTAICLAYHKPPIN